MLTFKECNHAGKAKTVSKVNKITLPVIPLRGLVVFPFMILHFDVGRKSRSWRLNVPWRITKKFFLTAQKDIEVEDPKGSGFVRIRRYCLVKQGF